MTQYHIQVSKTTQLTPYDSLTVSIDSTFSDVSYSRLNDEYLSLVRILNQSDDFPQFEEQLKDQIRDLRFKADSLESQLLEFQMLQSNDNQEDSDSSFDDIPF